MLIFEGENKPTIRVQNSLVGELEGIEVESDVDRYTARYSSTIFVASDRYIKISIYDSTYLMEPRTVCSINMSYPHPYERSSLGFIIPWLRV